MNPMTWYNLHMNRQNEPAFHGITPPGPNAFSQAFYDDYCGSQYPPLWPGPFRHPGSYYPPGYPYYPPPFCLPFAPRTTAADSSGTPETSGAPIQASGTTSSAPAVPASARANSAANTPAAPAPAAPAPTALNPASLTAADLNSREQNNGGQTRSRHVQWHDEVEPANHEDPFGPAARLLPVVEKVYERLNNISHCSAEILEALKHLRGRESPVQLLTGFVQREGSDTLKSIMQGIWRDTPRESKAGIHESLSDTNAMIRDIDDRLRGRPNIDEWDNFDPTTRQGLRSCGTDLKSFCTKFELHWVDIMRRVLRAVEAQRQVDANFYYENFRFVTELRCLICYLARALCEKVPISVEERQQAIEETRPIP